MAPQGLELEKKTKNQKKGGGNLFSKSTTRESTTSFQFFKSDSALEPKQEGITCKV